MHNPAATIASQNGHRNAAETTALTLILTPMNPTGKAIDVVPLNGMLMFNPRFSVTAWVISGNAINGITKNIMANSGFL